MGKKSKAAQLVSKSCYKAAFKMLWSAKGARKPMMEFWSKQLKEEVRTELLLVDAPVSQDKHILPLIFVTSTCCFIIK